MNTKKTLVAVIAAMLVAATLPCFAKGNVVTQWKGKDYGDTYFLTFYSDKTWELISIDEDGFSEKYEGTYSGDTTNNGKISIVSDDDAAIGEIVGDVLKFGDVIFFDDVIFIKVK